MHVASLTRKFQWLEKSLQHPRSAKIFFLLLLIYDNFYCTTVHYPETINFFLHQQSYDERIGEKNIRETLINFTFTCSLTLLLCIERKKYVLHTYHSIYLKDYSSFPQFMPSSIFIFCCLLFIQQSVDSCAKYCLWIDDEMQHQTNISHIYAYGDCVIFFRYFSSFFSRVKDWDKSWRHFHLDIRYWLDLVLNFFCV